MSKVNNRLLTGKKQKIALFEKTGTAAVIFRKDGAIFAE